MNDNRIWPSCALFSPPRPNAIDREGAISAGPSLEGNNRQNTPQER